MLYHLSLQLPTLILHQLIFRDIIAPSSTHLFHSLVINSQAIVLDNEVVLNRFARKSHKELILEEFISRGALHNHITMYMVHMNSIRRAEFYFGQLNRILCRIVLERSSDTSTVTTTAFYADADAAAAAAATASQPPPQAPELQISEQPQSA